MQRFIALYQPASLISTLQWWHRELWKKIQILEVLLPTLIKEIHVFPLQKKA